MAPVVKVVAVALLLLLATSGEASDLDTPAVAAVTPPLVARLRFALSAIDGTGVRPAYDGAGQGGDGGGWMMECWSAVTELRSCTNEIVLFFLNGESYLGHDCCLAIRTVTHHCWPAMLASVGFTAEEADILRGFCDAEVGAHAPPATPVVPPTAQAPAPAPSRALM